MRKLTLVVHTSLDGFVGGLKGELNDFPTGEENLEFVCKLTETADAALFGRVSHQLLESYWPTAGSLPNASKGTVAYSNWYNAAQKIVISKTLINEGLRNTIVISDNLLSEMTGIKKQSGNDILIFGSPAVSQVLMQLDLIDDYWIFINPIIFGKGIPMFSRSANKSQLKLLATQQFSNGEIALNYFVVRQ